MKVRTADELNKPEFNYFEAFKIKLDETNGDDIAKKINKLCLMLANSADPVKVRLGKELKADAIEIMQFDAIYDPTTGTYRRNAGGRKREADACRRMRTEKAAAFLNTLGSRDCVYLSEIQQIAEKNGVELKDLDGKLQALKKGGLNIIDDTQNAFDFKTYLELDKYLRSYEGGAYKDLFALMGIRRDVTAAVAQRMAAKSEADNAEKLQKRTNDGITLKFIYGSAKKIFDGSDASFNAYKKYTSFSRDVFMPLKTFKDHGFSNVGREEYLNYICILSGVLAESKEEAVQDLDGIFQYLHLNHVTEDGAPPAESNTAAAGKEDSRSKKLIDIVTEVMNGPGSNAYDFRRYQEVDKYLAVCAPGTKDLFSFLRLNANVSAAEAKSALLQRETADRDKVLKKTNEGLALKCVYGYAKMIFDGTEAHLKAYRTYAISRDGVFIPLTGYSKNGVHTIDKTELLRYISALSGAFGGNEEQAAQYLAYILMYLKLKISE